jgi:hypothetical protein
MMPESPPFIAGAPWHGNASKPEGKWIKPWWLVLPEHLHNKRGGLLATDRSISWNTYQTHFVSTVCIRSIALVKAAVVQHSPAYAIYYIMPPPQGDLGGRMLVRAQFRGGQLYDHPNILFIAHNLLFTGCPAKGLRGACEFIRQCIRYYTITNASPPSREAFVESVYESSHPGSIPGWVHLFFSFSVLHHLLCTKSLWLIIALGLHRNSINGMHRINYFLPHLLS